MAQLILWVYIKDGISDFTNINIIPPVMITHNRRKFRVLLDLLA